MAQRVNIVLVDDIDGSDATETVAFGLDGTSYEIDLNEKHAAKLRDALASYVGHARKVGGRRTRAAAKVSATGASVVSWLGGGTGLSVLGRAMGGGSVGFFNPSTGSIGWRRLMR